MARVKRDGSVNKSEEIRKELLANPKLKTRQVVENLASRGVDVNSGLVYMVKGKMQLNRRRQKRELAAKTSRELGIADPVDLIVKVRELADQAGGLKHLKRLVDVMAE